MKVENLMVGDWYISTDDDRETLKQVTISDFIRGNIPNFKGIPLSIEILLKNEFGKYDFSESESGYTVFEYGAALLPVTLKEINNEWDGNIYKSGHYFEYGPVVNGKFYMLGEIHYVHELQHLLKGLQFGIDFKL